MVRGTLSFDVAHLLAGSLVLVSFMQLYQDRLYALLNIYALHALVLASLGCVAGLRAGCTAPLSHRDNRLGVQGHCYSNGATSHHRAARDPPRD